MLQSTIEIVLYLKDMIDYQEYIAFGRKEKGTVLLKRK